MEATPTRRAGLERFTFPSKSKAYFVLDLANDLPASFAGGELNIDPEAGRITIGGRYGSRSVPVNSYAMHIPLTILESAASVQGGSTTKLLLVTTSTLAGNRNSMSTVFGQLTSEQMASWLLTSRTNHSW